MFWGSTHKFMSMRTKFIIIFFLLITIPFIISGGITYRKYIGDVEKSAQAYSEQLIKQININIDTYIKDLERITLAPFYDDTVLNILRNHRDANQGVSYVNTEEWNKMSLFISSLALDRPEVKQILFFANDGNLFSNSELLLNKQWNAKTSSWMDEIIQAGGGLVVMPPQSYDYYLDTTEPVISIARIVNDPSSFKTLGIVKVDLTAKGFEKILRSVSFYAISQLFITDQNGNVIYPIMMQPFSVPSGTQVYIDGQTYLSSSIESPYTKLRMTSLFLLDDLRADAREIIRFTAVNSLIALILAYLLAIVLSNHLVVPIRHIRNVMKKVQAGDFNVAVHIATHDEMSLLGDGFNVMVQEINRLIKEVYEVRIREREAELIALQSQINPHFLYNTLETISMRAVERNDMDLSDIVTNLGKLLRYTVDKQERPVLLKDEILFIESYLYIQKFRIGEKLKTEIHLDPSLESCLVPKLILQPFVENVIEHAIGRQQVAMCLRATIQWEDLLLIVQDNGVGISEEMLKKIEENMYSDRKDALEKIEFGKMRKGIALRNVHQRIILLYGDPYGVYIDRRPDGGTVFVIRLPYQWGDMNV